ncbi:MAG: plastocyanin/azurin family copper-binding protein [Actinomycetota bacterium]
MTAVRRPLLVGALVVAVTALVASVAVAVGAGNGGVIPGGSGFVSGSARAAPSLPGTVVNVSLTDSGGSMMGGRGGMMSGGSMRLSADQATVAHGTVSFLVTNGGGVNHEMVILPLPDSQTVGTRPIGGNAKIDEAGSLGEASNNNGKDAGEGVAPGASSWTTVTLAPGQYELVCNLAGHYGAGMYTLLTVT